MRTVDAKKNVLTHQQSGLHTRFPQYDYDDMIAAQHELLEGGLGVNHLCLVPGTSMGCMHAWVWAETYPDYMDALMPLACLPVHIAGRNQTSRQMVIDGIRLDPDWKNGDYTTEPRAALQIYPDIALIESSAPLSLQAAALAREAADKYRTSLRSRRPPCSMPATSFVH